MLLANVPFVAKDGSWEVDLIVLMPDVGFATIEVKGGYVRRADGVWRQQTPDGDKVIDLDDQAKSERYLVERYLKGRWAFGKPRMAHFAALPDTDLGPEDPSPGCTRPRDRQGRPRRGRGAGPRRAERHLANEPKRPPGEAAVEVAAQILGGLADPGRDRAAGERLLAATPTSSPAPSTPCSTSSGRCRGTRWWAAPAAARRTSRWSRRGAGPRAVPGSRSSALPRAGGLGQPLAR